MQYPGVTGKEEQEGYISNHKGKVRCRQKYDMSPSPIKHISVSDYLKEKEKEPTMNLKIYVFENTMGNYCSGDFYFIAPDLPTAVKHATKFSVNHNKLVNNNTNYTIEWDAENVNEVPIEEGYLALNRIMVPVTKY
jgi:hypothetical protein